jgi:hypothetical protein
MNDITVKYLGTGDFNITNKADLKSCTDNLKIGNIYSIQPKRKRNLKHHNLYWLRMTALAWHTGFTAKQLHRYTCDEILQGKLVEKNGLKIRLAPSECFDNMDDETEFSDYERKALEFWSHKGYDMVQCLMEYKNQLNITEIWL